MDFDGETYDAVLDGPRLTRQFDQVMFVMADSEWWTHEAIRQECLRVFSTSWSEGGIAARIRDFRKPKFGGHTVDERRVKGSNGQHEYRLS